MAKKMRNVEESVLRQLEKDSRTHLTQIAKKIRTSQQRVSYTISSLTEKEILGGFHTLIDYSKLDVLSFRVYFKVSYISEKKLEELISFLSSEEHTAWIETCGGTYDLICTFFTSNPSQFNKKLRSIMEKFPEQLKNYTVLTTAVIRHFGRKYLFQNPSIDEYIIGGDREPEEVDDVDLKIMGEIAEDPRKSSVEISNKLDVTPKTVINKIKRLEEKDIIRGYKPLLDLRTIGYNSTLLLIRYHNITAKIENKLINYLKAHPNVVSAVKTLGEWDIEIELEVEDITKLRKIEVEIRKKFALLIQQIESIPLYKTYKKNFFPKFLLSE